MERPDFQSIACGASAIAMALTFALSTNWSKVDVKGAWSGPARLHLVPHVNAPVADLPVKKVVGGSHFVANLTLPYGRVLYDYLKNNSLDPAAKEHLEEQFLQS